MSIIQDIRDKYAKVTVVLIALALLGFILTDYFSGKARGSRGSGSNSIGRVNGKSIAYDEFNKKVDITEQNMKDQYQQSGAGVRQQAIEQTWTREVETILLEEESKKLGLGVGKKELNDLLYGADPSPIAKQYLGGQGGDYNPAQVLQTINQIRKGKDQNSKNQLNELLNYIVQEKEKEKLVSLFANSINFPRWLIEKQNADNSLIAKISTVKETYTSIPDSAVKVEDKEIADYISKHKKDFKQAESRSISYVTFSAAPSAADSLATRNNLLQLKAQFDSTHDMAQFLAGEGVANYYNGYIRDITIQIALKDSIFKTPVGSIYGPYMDGGSYVLAKVIGTRQMPDSAKVRHILIGTSQRDPQTGQSFPTRDTTTAFNLADSIRKEIAKGSIFDSLVVKFSDDGGSKDKGGLYESVYSGQMVPPFNDFIFLNPPGTKGIVKTDFGYHYIEILSQKGNGSAYKIAYLSKEIVASQETDNAASEKAYTFVGDSPDAKAFDANYEKNLKPAGILKGIGTDIKPIDADIRGLGNSRNFIRSIYDAKVGEVLKPERIGENYVVALVTEVAKEGTQDPAKARGSVEPLLRNKKKAALLKQKIGKVTTLEAAALALGGKPVESVDSLRMVSYRSPSLGFEPRIIGAAFNPANKGKVVPEPLEGINGVYVIRVDNISTTAVTEGSISDQRKTKYDQAKQYAANAPMTILKDAATIKDNRAEKF